MNHFEETLSTRLISITAGKLLETIFNFAACGGNLFSDVDPSQILRKMFSRSPHAYEQPSSRDAQSLVHDLRRVGWQDVKQLNKEI